MKSIILASGIGSRMEGFDNLPKPLIPVAGSAILGRILNDLAAQGLHDVVITTGYKADNIRDYVKEISNIQVSFVHNPRFADTNYMYSLWLAREAIAGDDVLLFHGDVVYDPALLKKLLAEPASAVLVHSEESGPSKDFQARITDGHVTEIGVGLAGPDTFASMPIYKLTKADLNSWMESIDRHVAANDLSSYAEDALNEVFDRVHMKPCFFKDELCMEVDTAEDLERANRILSGR